MPFGIVLLLINVGLIVHAAKTGRFWPWGYIILFIPGFGALAYVLVELLPEWFGSVQGQKARRHVVNTLDPSKRYRALTEQLEVADTIANRAALAEECLELGKFTEAEYHYERILALPMGDDMPNSSGSLLAAQSIGPWARCPRLRTESARLLRASRQSCAKVTLPAFSASDFLKPILPVR
jgi:hypothetical protein